VRTERDNLAAELTKKERRQLRGGFARRTFVIVLVTLFAILLPITLTMGWAHRTVLNTNAYVNTMKPIAQDPRVTAAVSRQITIRFTPPCSRRPRSQTPCRRGHHSWPGRSRAASKASCRKRSM